MEGTQTQFVLDLLKAFFKDIKDGIQPSTIKDFIIKEATKELSGEDLGSFILFINEMTEYYG